MKSTNTHKLLYSHASVTRPWRLRNLIRSLRCTTTSTRSHLRNVASTLRLRPPSCLPKPLPLPRQDKPRQAPSHIRRLPRRWPRKPLPPSVSSTNQPTPSPMIVLTRNLDIPRCCNSFRTRTSTTQRAGLPSARARHIRRLGPWHLLAPRYSRSQPYRQRPCARRRGIW
jgi:hypothetical protein